MPTRHTVLRAFGSVLLLALPSFARPARAQLVRGVVVDSVAGTPVAGAIVRLVDSTARPVAGTLTGANGRFDFRAPSPARYFVHVQRVGFPLAIDGPLDVAALDTVWRRVAIPFAPISLDAVALTGGGGCEVRPDGVETLLVWEEARKALDAMLVTRGTRRIRAAVVDYDRLLDLRTLGVRSEKREERTGVMERPYISHPAEDLAEHGYMQHVKGEMWLYAPDADVLLSPRFLDHHCLRLVPGVGARAEQIGLGFEPAPSRRVPDVAGVLWLDRRTARLRELEYRYTGLPDYMPADRIGGRIEFAALPNGGWIIRRWSVRVPVMEPVALQRLGSGSRGGFGSADDPGAVARVKVTGIREAAGEVLWATTTSGEPLLGAAPPDR